MPLIDRDTARLFQSRFYSFVDGIVRSFEVRVPEGEGLSVVVLIATQDSTRPDDDRWVCVRLVVKKVESFCCADANSPENRQTYSGVLSSRVNVCWFGDSVGLELGNFLVPPRDMAELKTSKLFVVGRSVEWTVEPYC